MKPNEDIQRALARTSGARFYRCALQVNPPTYAAQFRGRDHGLSAAQYTRQIVAKCGELGIGVLAATDHNSAAWTDELCAAATEHGIVVFPGFEVASSEGVHVLCLYGTEATSQQLDRFLGELGIRDLGASALLANKPFGEVLDTVRAQGGITIAAHVTQEKGLLTALHGQAAIRAWRDPNLLAVQLPGSVDDTPQDKKAILRNQNHDYRREHPVARKLAVAVVNAADIVAPDDLEDPGATCSIKMSRPSIEGLRQAFLDPESRIRLSSDPAPEDHAELVAMSWHGGFLDGAAIHFNENLNVLVGGRGAGKSTVIESVRYVLNLNARGREAQEAHEGVVRHVLKPGTRISLLVRSHRPTQRDYVIERTIPNPPLVSDAKTGQVLPLTPTDVMPAAEVFGQHEISELAKSPERLTALLDRFVERDASIPNRKHDLKRDLAKVRTTILEIGNETRQVEERLAALPGLEETLRRFQEAGLEERLQERSVLVREEQVLKTALDRLQPLSTRIEELARDLPIDAAFASAKVIERLPARPLLSEIAPIFDRLSGQIREGVTAMAAAIANAEAEIKAIRTRFAARRAEVQARYEQILRDLQKSKIDGEEFIRLRHQIEELRPLRERQALLKRSSDEAIERRRNLLAEWERVLSEDFQRLDRAAKDVNRQLIGRVNVKVDFSGDREPLAKLLKDRVGGRLSDTLDALRSREDLSLRELAESCRAGKDELLRKFSIPAAQAERLAGAGPEVWMLVEELELPPTTQVRLNVAPEGNPEEFVELQRVSTGQKATAVLLLLLLESEAPLVVDQPEDDLDNRFISEGVVPKMREEKRRRQFLFATHNANIPVLGDAELIIGLSASGEADQGHARVDEEKTGSIDTEAVRALVEEVLEGGREAFETRRRKYRF
ncbi:MAG: AAA family ATPase [Deltaproteobacteria bacterium]|nr:AAA family ATPase [Deltaproteobacteria bacterium]